MGADELRKGLVQATCGRFFHADGERHSGSLQSIETASADLRIWITHRRNYSRDACLDERVGTGWSAAMMTTGFQGDIASGAARCRARLLQRNNFGVVLVGVGMKAFADDVAVLDQNTSGDRIGGSESDRCLGQAQRTFHPKFIRSRFRWCHVPRDLTRLGCWS